MKKLIFIILTVSLCFTMLLGCSSNASSSTVTQIVDNRFSFYDGTKFGYISEKGKVVISAQYDKVSDFNEGLAWVQKNNETYFIDSNGTIKFKLDAKYVCKDSFNGGLCVICDNSNPLSPKYGAINTEGKIVIPATYDKLNTFNNNYASFKLDNSYGLIDNTGKVILEPKYDFLGNYNDGLINAERNGKYGYVNKYGVFVIDTKYDGATSFNNGTAMIKQADYWKLIDKNEKVLSETGYPAIWGSYGEGFYGVAAEFRFGFIDTYGKEVIKRQYDQIDSFSNGLAAVKVDDKWGFINKNNDMIIAPQFDSIYKDFKNGIACVSKDNKMLFIDKKGSTIYEGKIPQ